MAAPTLQMGICPGKRDRLKDAPRLGEDPKFYDRAIEVRDADATERLLGWVLGKWTRNCRAPGLPAINFSGELATDPLGASMGCTGPGTLLATELLRTEVRVDRHIATTLPRAGKQFAPRSVHPYPDYAHHEFTQALMTDAIEVESSWRFLPVTMTQFDWLFDRAEFVAAGDEVREVSGLNWATGPEPRTSRSALSEIYRRAASPSFDPPKPPGFDWTSYTTAPVAHLPDPKTALLDAISVSYDPPKIDWGAVTNATTIADPTVNVEAPKLTPELLANMRRQIEKAEENAFLKLYPPTFAPLKPEPRFLDHSTPHGIVREVIGGW